MFYNAMLELVVNETNRYYMRFVMPNLYVDVLSFGGGARLAWGHGVLGPPAKANFLMLVMI